MDNWNKPLKRENFDAFFDLYSSAAYKPTYKLLGDTTRTENVLIESFIETYQKRKEVPPDQLVYTFGVILQKKIEPLSELFPVREAENGSTRTLDDFTKNSMLMEIHKQIDSMSYHFWEMFLFNIGSDKGKENSLLNVFRSTGINLLSIIQIIILAIIIYFAASLSSSKMLDATENIPQNPSNSIYSISDQLVGILEYMPLSSSNAVVSDAPQETVSSPDETETSVVSNEETSSGEGTSQNVPSQSQTN